MSFHNFFICLLHLHEENKGLTLALCFRYGLICLYHFSYKDKAFCLYEYEQILAKKEGGVIDRSQDIALLQDFYKLYREQNDMEKLREEELNLRETGAFSGDLGDKKKIEERKCWLRRFEPGTHLDQKNSKQAFPFWFAFVSLPKGEDTDVKRDDLARALMVAFSSTSLLEPYVIPLLFEKLSSSLPSSKVGAITKNLYDYTATKLIFLL
ncbi:callose synthase 10-like isoform X2 [Humulus lupulus]|uniref:callose synthase 10-like isoform X2 n=1 Tax=Humulus lupulus TaxID=3486 RepID=UPI002B4153CE|nr:callose synthase 10-like isoform X2 [Humulus lupulus]XP_062101533.1 callose synthase 10-like isoform X2 [Humulus lupulus]XP_062101534.1 callose synthase 10-like isoform X2 [Humulus lupulus]